MIEETTASRSAALTQLDWLVGASARLPLSTDEIRTHAAPGLVDTSGGPDGVNAFLAALGPLTVAEIVAVRPDRVQAVVQVGGRDHLFRLRVDQTGRVDNVDLNPHEPTPASWAEIDTRLAALGARVSFAAAEIEPDGQCRTVHGLDADVLRPIGSGVKLYVLGALGQAVVDGQATWAEPLAIRDDWRSPFSSELENQPTGAPLTLAEHADAMISISDNTATDHLIHRLGRDAVLRQFALFGQQRPEANALFPTTKAFFHLKIDSARARQYLALAPHERAAELAELDRLPLLDTRPTWTRPRDIDQIEFFASPADICRAYAGLMLLDQPEIDHALSIADHGLNLDESRFATVWFKPGSEPGVMALNYLGRTVDGRSLAISLLMSDPAEAFDIGGAAVQGQSVIRGAFTLMAASR
jgi:hypothetical protein